MTSRHVIGCSVKRTVGIGAVAVWKTWKTIAKVIEKLLMKDLLPHTSTITLPSFMGGGRNFQGSCVVITLGRGM